MFYVPLSPEHLARLASRAASGARGEDIFFACNADEETHLHFMRLGDPGDRDEGRVGFTIHGPGGGEELFLTAGEARSVAAHILNVADELDGTQPLMFWHPDEVHTEPPYGDDPAPETGE